MMESNTIPRGNIEWQYFVYGTYGVVVLLLIIYVFFALYTRRNALKNLVEEGFLETKNNTENFKNENKN